MADQKKLDRWADKLLDTGKRNNLINYRDTKASSAEILYPDCSTVFGKCSVGHVFEVFDPKIPDPDISDPDGSEYNEKSLSKEEFKNRYVSRIRSGKHLLVYGQTPNPITAVKNIAKRAQTMLDETGINVAYLAFGLLKWNEKEGSEVFYRAPLLLVHVNIVKGSIIEPIKIEISDDDVVVNPTFSYLLEAEYGLKLPEYEDEDTLDSYYGKVSNTVRGLGWEILDECKLGIFSFLKINMYEDLKKNSDQILKNGNIQALLGESGTEVDVNAGLEVEVDNPLIDLHTVVDADSSQIEAIEMAKSGKSFVLQGPPGTGKSQTITNIIAECLHDGKKVLFVSEKQAALNVVFDKLKKAGLDDFCLELHSHKANKKAVIEELNRTLEMPKSSVSSSTREEIRQKKEAQIKLDTYASELHKKRNVIDKSLYQLFELYSAQRAYPDVQYSINNIQSKGQDYFINAVRLLEQYSEYVPSVGQDYHKNAWFGFSDPGIDYEERSRFKTDLESMLQGYLALQGSTAIIKEKYGASDFNLVKTRKWQSLLSLLAESDAITPAILSQDAFYYAFPYLSAMRESSEIIVPIRNALLEGYDSRIIGELDGKDLYTKLTGQFGSFFSRAFSGEYKTLIANIQLYGKSGEKLKYQQALELTENLMKLQSALKTFGENEAIVSGCLGPCYKGYDTDWTYVMSDLETLKGHFSIDDSSFGLISKMDSSDYYANRSSFKSDSDILASDLQKVEDVQKRVSEKFAAGSFDFEKNIYTKCIQKLNGCISEYDKLGNWISFMSLLDQLKDADLSGFIDQVINEEIEADEIPGVYKKVFYKHWIEYILFSVPELATFTRIKQDQAVQTFNAKDSLQYKINKIWIRSELSQQRPNLDIVAGGSAVALLRREANKKRKQMPIRKLLSELGPLVQMLKPCFLMSPLSVSTFLDPEKISFDTVIFDEASQIFPQDAVGAIYRGKQLIVVGDSRQMPPSNFFNASMDVEDDDEEIGDVNDFESILDVCSSVFTTERLAWHYRSHYEQLIAFSNLHFYNNHLVTFPASAKDRKGIGVDYYYVDGTFDRKSKTNRIEAEFIVELVYKNIKEHPERSLGVVAFSVAQQSLIDKLISKRREADPSYEWFFKSDNAEPFFIKNLETVQGDERDTIIFSVAYAKDSQGRFIQNFGPLNRAGGERRLNVAVTRAKDNVQLVASIHYTDINLSNTESEGVRLLRAYLDYAQNGEEALERAITVSSEDKYDSYFEQEVCDFLRDNGFTVDTQIGCSGYSIDLGLRKPDSSNYLLAIECDGATYHTSRNARDRDSLRQKVLERMGWKFYRIWSTDWYRNQVVEKERLLQVAKDAVSEDSDPDDNSSSGRPKKASSIEDDAAARFVIEGDQIGSEFPKYKELDAVHILSKHSFYMGPSVKEILETEAPLSEEYLLKRIVTVFDREKVTKHVVDRYNYYMRGCEREGIIRRGGFLYLQGKDAYVFRVPGDRREIKYISIEELAEGFHILISQNVTATIEGLYKTMTNLLGFSRTGDAIESRFDKALSLLIKEKKIKEEQGVLSCLIDHPL